MKKKIAADPWFQMFAAVAGTAAVISMFGTVSTRHSLPKAAPSAASAPAAPAPAPAAAPAAAPADAAPSPKSSSDLATYDPLRPPAGLAAAPVAPDAAAPPPSPPPQMTLTGAGVGNANGIVGAPAGGGAINGFLTMLGMRQGLQQQAQAVPQVVGAPFNRVVPEHKGVFRVGPVGGMGADTTSLRDAAFSAASGDLILVEPGTYEGPVEVGDKSVRIRGTGTEPSSVVINWTGPGGAVSLRSGTLELENLRVVRGSFPEFPASRPGGAVYAAASTLVMRKVELHSDDSAAPPLILEQSDKATRVTAVDSELSGSRANLVARGAVKASLTRVSFDSPRPVVAWIDAVIELKDCRFTGSGTEINAYENARVVMSGKQKIRVKAERGSDAGSIEEIFGGARRPGLARTGFARDIFRRGRRPGELP